MSTYIKRLAVDDLILHVLQDGTFDVGRIPIQDSLGVHRMKRKCHDRYSEDLASDPMYNNILVKLFPNDGPPTDVLPKDLVILDRNFTIGQLVKQQSTKGDVGKVGYISSITQTASALLYQPDEVKRKDPFQELYFYNKPASFFQDPSKCTLKEGDAVFMDGWLGIVQDVRRVVILKVLLSDALQPTAEISQADLFAKMISNGIQENLLAFETCKFERNGINGICIGRYFKLPYACLVGLGDPNSSFRWSPPILYTPDDTSVNVGVTVIGVLLGELHVDWKQKIEENEKPDVVINCRGGKDFTIASHPRPLKIGDIRVCNMNENEWKTVMNRYAWRSCIAKDYFLHKRRGKRPRVDENSKEILPSFLPAEVAVEIVATVTNVDVLWTDGTVGQGVDSRDLDPVRYQWQFPGAIVNLSDEPQRRFDAVGEDLTHDVNYSVVLSTKITSSNYNGDKFSWTVQDYLLGIGALWPIPMGVPRAIADTDLKEPTLRICWLWVDNVPVVVTKIKRSPADFLYGCVIGMFPDGQVRIRKENGVILSVWPTDLIPLVHPKRTNGDSSQIGQPIV